MTGSAPKDVAVAFRSFPRRLASALAGAEDDEQRRAAAPQVAELEGLIRATAARLGLPTTGSASDLAGQVADALDGRPADAWTAEDLEAIRAAGLDGGHLLREIEAAVEQ